MPTTRTLAIVQFRHLIAKLRRIAGGRASRRRTPEGVHIYAVGDIRGRADLLRALLASIAADAREAPAARKILIYLQRRLQRRSRALAPNCVHTAEKETTRLDLPRGQAQPGSLTPCTHIRDGSGSRGQVRSTHPRDVNAACHAYIQQRCSFSYAVTGDGAEARQLEKMLKKSLEPSLNP